MRILTLDQATATGWAFGVERSEEKFLFGSFKMPKRDDNGERLVIFRDGLVELIETHRPDLIAYETPYMPIGESKPKPEGYNGPKRAPMNVNTVKFLHNIEGVLIETTARHGIPTEHFPSSSWRITALGFGRLPANTPEGVDFKKLMKQKAKQLGYAVGNDNESDALGMLLHMMHGAPAAARAQGDLLDRVSGL